MALNLPSTDPQPLAAGLYRTDAFHRQPLFAVGSEVVRSWTEAHALHGDALPDDVNPAYVAALISGNHNAEAAPYPASAACRGLSTCWLAATARCTPAPMTR
jgi:hypothetical protein